MNNYTIKYITRVLKQIAKIANHRLHKLKRQRVILMYHGISSVTRKNCVTQDLLNKQISWLKERYLIVPLSSLIKRLNSSSLSNDTDLLSFTFDDGYSNFAELALPILQKYNCHSTLFVSSGKVGTYNAWDENNKGFQKMKIMSYRELRMLPDDFVEIGSHGISHIPLYSKLPFNVISAEIIRSRIELEQHIGKAVKFFAFPYGVYPFKREFIQPGNQNFLWSGYSAACTSWWGRYNSGKDIFKLRRIGVWHSDSFVDFVYKLTGYYDWLEVKENISRYIKMKK